MPLQLWENRKEKKLDPALFSSKAEEFAQKISHEAKGTTNKGTQLRKFFDEILRLDTLAQNGNADWNILLPQVHMLVAKAAYAQGRKLVSESFVRHIREGVNQIEDKADLHVFSSHMEAFMGFYKLHNEEN